MPNRDPTVIERMIKAFWLVGEAGEYDQAMLAAVRELRDIMKHESNWVADELAEVVAEHERRSEGKGR